MAKQSEDYCAFITKELKKGNVKYLDVASLFCAKFRLTRRSFDKYWKKANELHSSFVQERETKLNDTTISESIQSLSNGLKTKSQRLLNLQKQVDEINGMLLSGITPDTIIDAKTLTSVDIERRITYIERAQLMKALRDLQSEISKIEGDYAATTTKIEIQKEQPLFPDNK